MQCFIVIGCVSRAMGKSSNVATRTGDQLNRSIGHCCDVRTRIGHLSAFWLPDCFSIVRRCSPCRHSE